MLVINCRALKLKLCKLVKFPGGSEQCIEILKPSKYQGVLCLMNFSIKGIKATRSKGGDGRVKFEYPLPSFENWVLGGSILSLGVDHTTNCKN